MTAYERMVMDAMQAVGSDLTLAHGQPKPDDVPALFERMNLIHYATRAMLDGKTVVVRDLPPKRGKRKP